MNTTIIYNLTNLPTINPYNYPIECMKEGKYSIECLYKIICPQFNQHFINLGIGLIIFYIVMSWLLWWYFNHGYKRFYPKPNKFIGDLNLVETRIYWDTWIRARMTTLLIGYIAMVVWLAKNILF